ncbi:hypothetical protein [Actinoplanes sp. TBRC 11911]|uniref:hypothetical protein n=1 Tax=Actinoplanes sp. TBRC 11911 TaxID=2729386 RepID=UPI00289D020D|nr:hypothetical protein [Actinoplanes sp. TBRC 11911]
MAELAELRAVPAARARLDAEELALIDRARREGATWADIADALGLTSRQAAEQRRLRLATAASAGVRAELDRAYGQGIAGLRAAAAELHRRVGADRRWDRRFVRAALVRETLEASADAPGGSLFSLAAAVVGDLSPEVTAALPGPSRAAVGRLRAALEAAAPQP